MRKFKNVTIGADIELFLQDKELKEVVSAEGFIKGTKNEPFNFDKTNKYFATSLDNVATEFCIPPVTNKKDFINYIKKAVDYINSTVPNNLCTVVAPAAIFADKFLQTDNAKTFGCEPDYCVWTRSMNEKPSAPNPNLRSCGGHIHIGYDNSEDLGIELKEDLIKCMDLCVGVPSVLQEPDNERKLLYGKAGCFRFKNYGVEYRTVSNYYLANNALMSWAYDSTKAAVNMADNGFKFTNTLSRNIQSAINNNNKSLAEKLVKQFRLELA